MPDAARDAKSASPLALAPSETLSKACAVGAGKAQMSLRALIPLSLFGGIFIGCGALFMYFGKSGIEAFGPQSVVGGLCFSLGLLCVIISGAELFTGNCLMVIGALEKRYSWGRVAGNWALTWVFNFIGALILVSIVFGANLQSLGSGAIGTAMVATAANKVALPWGTIFCRGIICNLLVCLAVWMGFAGETVIDKVFTTIFPVMAFVAVGAEHCVANMFFLPMGLFVKLSGGIGLSGIANAASLDLGGIFWNLSAATLGNIVGGAVFVGVLYWAALHKKRG